MRLLHVTHQYRPAIGGAETYIADLSETLARRGHHIDVFTSRSVDYRTWRSALPGFERLNGVDVYRFRSLPRTDHVWRALKCGFKHYWRTRRWWYEPFIFYGNGPVSLGMLAALMRRVGSYDLVHINNLHYAHALLAYLAARLRRVPYVITPHLHAEQRETHDVGYMHTILRDSHAILTVSRAEKQYLLMRGWNDRVIVGGNGLRLEDFPVYDRRACRAHFGLPDAAFVMLFLGRKTAYKGLELCLDAFLTLRQVREDIHFLAVGPETEFSQRLWERRPEVKGLVVRGRVSDEERLKALQACDVLVLPSVGEAFGIVYLEAWAYEKPVIGADIASVASIIDHGVDGLLVAPQALGRLVKGLSQIADNPSQAQEMGRRGREKLEERYTVERIADIVEGTCARVIRAYGTG